MGEKPGKIYSPKAESIDTIDPFITPDELVSNLEDGKSVLDVGCGSGSFDYAKRPGVEIHACDVFPDPIVPNLPNVQYRQMVGESLDYPSDSFDLIILNFVLEHTENPEQIVKLCFKIAKPGGMLYVSVPNAIHYEDRAFRACDRFLKIITLKPFDRIEHIQHFNEDRVRSIGINAGFGQNAKAFIPAGFAWIYNNIQGLSDSKGLKSRTKLLIFRWNLLMAVTWLKINRLIKPSDPRRGANIVYTFRKPGEDVYKATPVPEIKERFFSHSCGYCGLPVNLDNVNNGPSRDELYWKCPRCQKLNII